MKNFTFFQKWSEMAKNWSNHFLLRIKVQSRGPFWDDLFLFFLFNLRLGMPSFQKSAVFLNIVQKAFDPPPPPFIWTFVLFCRGCFLNAFLSIWYNVPILPPNFTINASNVGVREAPCKKSFGILASYWTPPKIK